MNQQGQQPPTTSTSRAHDHLRPSRLNLLWWRIQQQRRAFVLSGVLLAVLAVLGLFIHHVALRGWHHHALAGHNLNHGLGSYSPIPVKRIVVRGQAITPLPAIMGCLHTHEGADMLAFSVEEARHCIDGLPFVAHTVVERHLPGTIIVTVTEHHPVALWQFKHHYRYINEDGALISERDLHALHLHDLTPRTLGDNGPAGPSVPLPLLVGAGANDDAGHIVQVLAAHPTINQHVRALVRVGQRRWNLELRSGTVVMLPEGHEDAAMARLELYQKRMALLDRPLKRVDMRLPDRMVLGLPPQTAAQAIDPAEATAPVPGANPASRSKPSSHRDPKPSARASAQPNQAKMAHKQEKPHHPAPPATGEAPQ
ncbi:FtsQ-type POTRA domain-containing protein [Formicincola oecophyllae]|uniref:Cell division protein FtsQ n=1 Tax=Formicincola oecophyllae TaxID=2558361 RepID=A0A4Y6U6M7_9PROT|nr:cell division protein FtsQ/DivIB [Formicincola oecophyllae]QDH13012.1 FtsQ-type POTRA domain-containing protein [Formicincola oecophyllae]